MKVYILIQQKPLNIKVYSSLVALIEDNNSNVLKASRSKLEKHPFDEYDYISYNIIISKRQTQSSGDVRRKKEKHIL